MRRCAGCGEWFGFRSGPIEKVDRCRDCEGPSEDVAGLVFGFAVLISLSGLIVLGCLWIAIRAIVGG